MKDWAKFQKERNLYDPFAVSMAAGMTLTTIAFGWRGGGCTGRGEYNTGIEIPRLQTIRKCVTIFPIWKTRGRREYMCTPHYRKSRRTLYKEFRLGGMCRRRMEDGFGEALLEPV